MEKNKLENRIKELELELSYLSASRKLMEQANHPILILKGEDMILELANDALFKIWNVGKEALGKSFLEILPEMKDQPFMGLLLDVFHNRKTQYCNNQRVHFTRANGEIETIYLNFVYQPYKEIDGTVSGVLVFANDVTEQVKQKIDFEKVIAGRTSELYEINKELVFENEGNEKRATELVIARKELVFQNTEKEKRATELIIANKELAFQNKQKEKRAAELVIANKELIFQNEEKEKRAAELIIANKELAFQSELKEKRAEE
ncbi:PAS domain-containing protein, partial [Emticicia sp.]|uniref:PAS domain-containing protein n=1 Tax=Emticicia sp. TaxID=1930953 RepID=UPI003750BC7D